MIQTTIGIEGMACEMCEAHINEVIRRNFPVKSAKADRRKHRCVVVSESELDQDLLRKVIAETGYELTSVTSGPHKKKGLLGLF